MPRHSANIQSVMQFHRGQERRIRTIFSISLFTAASLQLSRSTNTTVLQANLFLNLRGLNTDTKCKTTWPSVRKCLPVIIAGLLQIKTPSKSQTLQVESPLFSCSDCIE